VAEVLEHLLYKWKTLNSNPSVPQTPKKEYFSFLFFVVVVGIKPRTLDMISTMLYY
jgi:hypothetical protein